MKRARLLLLGLGLAACSRDPGPLDDPRDQPAPHVPGTVPEAGASRFAGQCQYRDFAATAPDGTAVSGELHVAEVATSPGDVAGVVLGPVPASGYEARWPVEGSVATDAVTLTILLPDTTTLSLSGTSDALVADCRGAMKGDVALEAPDGGRRDDAGTSGAADAGAPRGTWYARSPAPPPATASDCITHGADPLVCGVYE
jgi:hypothetical protein